MANHERAMNLKAADAVRLLREAGPLPDDVRCQLLDILFAPTRPPKMTYEEFLAWADEDTLAEWVDGEVVTTSLASQQHQRIVRFLDTLLWFYSQMHGLGEVIQAPFQMRLARSGREPDVLYVAPEHLARLQETFLDGPADLVIEVVSPESAGRDRGDKFYEYEAAGVTEYWLFDPQRREAEYYRLNDDSRYVLALSGSTGTYHSQVMTGFWVKTEWLWAEEMPSPLAALAEIAGLDPASAEAFRPAPRTPRK
jgi:Uma2 family endonuclease